MNFSESIKCRVVEHTSSNHRQKPESERVLDNDSVWMLFRAMCRLQDGGRHLGGGVGAEVEGLWGEIRLKTGRVAG